MCLLRSVVAAVAVTMFSAAIVFAQSGQADTGKAAAANTGAEKIKPLKPQTICPIMGGKINKKEYADFEGKRVYFCCKGCVPEFNKDPAKYMKKLEEMGQVPETAPALKPQTTCPVMTGQPIDRSLYVDYKGKRIYVCCENCIEPFKKNPEKYIKKLESMGQSVETIGDGTKKESNDAKTDTSMKGMEMKGMKMAADTAIKAADLGYWTCPMHPEIHQLAAGQCPICGMNLVFKKSDKDTVKMKGMDHSKIKMNQK